LRVFVDGLLGKPTAALLAGRERLRVGGGMLVTLAAGWPRLAGRRLACRGAESVDFSESMANRRLRRTKGLFLGHVEAALAFLPNAPENCTLVI
jgi:hypothetical protein